MIPILFDLEPSVDKYWLNNIYYLQYTVICKLIASYGVNYSIYMANITVFENLKKYMR